MPIDVTQLAKAAFDAALGAAKGHAKDLTSYLKARSKLIADSVALIAADRLAGELTDDDVRFAFEQIRVSEKTAMRAVKVTTKAAAQDAINAALAVAGSAIKSAIGVAV